MLGGLTREIGICNSGNSVMLQTHWTFRCALSKTSWDWNLCYILVLGDKVILHCICWNSLCSCEHVAFSDPYEDCITELFLGCLCGVKPQQAGIPQIRGLGQGSSWVQPHILGICPTPWALSFKKHEANFSKNLNICRSWGIDHDTYFLRVERDLTPMITLLV
jgi:hypothetical protein